MPTPILSSAASFSIWDTGLEDVRKVQRRSIARRAAVLAGATVAAAVLSFAMENPLVGPAAVTGTVLLVLLVRWLWDEPVRSVYVLFGAAVLLAAYDETGLTDYIGAYVPFFRDIKSWSHTGIIVSPAEMFMALALCIWLLKGIAQRDLHFDRGTLMLPVGLYMAFVLMGELRGLGTGGDLRNSLWELRGQVYMLVAYVLVCNLIKSRRQLTTLLWVMLVCSAARGVEGTFQYLFVLRAQDMSKHELYPHEQSYFFNASISLTIVLFLFHGPQRMRRFALYLMPFILIANIANNRRASIAALIISLLALVLITWLTHPRARRPIAIGLVVLGIVYPPYFMHYRNNTGFLALPARAISSSFSPNATDQSSNQYRVYEDLDIMSTVKTSPVIGVGFGKNMLDPYPLPDIGYVFQYLMPHNSILWVWMRLGTLGYLVLWFMIGTAIIQATSLARRLRDPWLQGLAIFIVLMLVQQVIISYVDLQWSNYRTMIATGVLFALISRVAAIGAAGVSGTAREAHRGMTVARRERSLVLEGD